MLLQLTLLKALSFILTDGCITNEMISNDHVSNVSHSTVATHEILSKGYTYLFDKTIFPSVTSKAKLLFHDVLDHYSYLTKLLMLIQRMHACAEKGVPMMHTQVQRHHLANTF